MACKNQFENKKSNYFFGVWKSNTAKQKKDEMCKSKTWQKPANISKSIVL